MPRTSGRWDGQRVVSTILARRRRREPLNYHHVPRRLLAAGVRYFGSWRAAIEAAGLDYAAVRLTRDAWTADAILGALREGARSPRTGTGSDGFVSRTVVQAAIRAFGSLPSAILAAGLDPERLLRHRDRTDRELEAILKQLAAKHPNMTVTELARHRVGATVKHRFGNLESGLARLGFDGWPKRLRMPGLSASEVLDGLQQRQRRGRSLRYSAVNREEPRLVWAAVRQFGSWPNALREAGLGSFVHRSRTKHQVLEDLVTRHARGEPLATSIMKRDDRPLVASAVHHFRSLPRALAAAGLPLAVGTRLRRMGFTKPKAERTTSYPVNHRAST